MNKIGTYPLVLAVSWTGISFVAALESTIDMVTASGAPVEIEIRDSSKIIRDSATIAVNYDFDITPADLVTTIVIDERIIHGKPLG